MCNSEKIKFIDKVVTALSRYCPVLGDEVKYFIACQFALESRFGQSRRAKEDNNFCGMKTPSMRPTLTSSLSDFAKYDSFDDCVIDYIYWLCYNKFYYNMLTNVSLFSRHLIASKYCPDSDYIDKIYQLFNSLKS